MFLKHGNIIIENGKIKTVNNEKFYQNEEKVYKIFSELFNCLKEHPVIGPKLLATKLILEVIISDLDARLIIDAFHSPPKLFLGECKDMPKPDVTMIMSASITHRFWLGQINLPWALLKKDIIAKGSIEKIFKVLPILSPAFEIYRKIVSVIKN